MSNNRGSEWRKWDLHFHTPSSYDYKDKSVTDEQIIAKLKENNISVVAVTDHHLIDVDRIKKLQDLGEKEGIVVLPGIEFCSELGGSEAIHFIAIFPEDSNISDIWIKIQGKHNLTKASIKEKGNERIICRFEETCKTIKELGGIITVHAGTKSNTIESIKNNLLIKQELKQELLSDYIDILEIGKVDDQKSYREVVFPKINFKLPVIICSDNHDIKNYNLKENCWIKADPTFEGLKQIIYEPEERVRIQENKPDEKEDKEIIDKIRFISPNNQFSNKEIYLNPNLNVIIGGKSSGKSILLYSIAKTLLPNDKDPLLFKSNGEEKYDLSKIDDSINFEITTKAGISQKMSERKDNVSIIPNIKYIPQNELVKLAEPELSGKGEPLNKLVRQLICEDIDSKQKYDEIFIKNVREYDKSRNELIDKYFETLDVIEKLKNELKTKSNQEVLEANIKTNLTKVEELNKKAGLSIEQIQQYKDIQGKQQQNQQRIDLFKDDFHQTNTFLQELKNELDNLQTKKATFLQSIKTATFRGYYQTKLSFIDESISQIENLIKEIELNENSEGKKSFANENPFKNELDIISSEKKNIENKMKPYQQNQEIQIQIKKLNESIVNDRKLLSEIDTLNKKITEKNELSIKIKDDLFQLYKKSFDEYTNIIGLLKERTIQLEKDGLKIKGIAQFNFDKFRNNILSFTDGRSASNYSYDILNGDKTRFTEYEYLSLENEVKNIFEGILSGKYVVNSKYGQREIVKRLLDDYFYDYWEITYKNDKLGEMSTGKASFVILMLIIGLSNSKSPILIDQPEDNLDNRSVSENIISYLREKKIERQIILVTHNANIVVNADAENVIVANQRGQNDKESTSPYKFDYINGAIENTFAKIDAETDLLKSMGIKEHIADIVEGGKEAFKKREKKYGFK